MSAPSPSARVPVKIIALKMLRPSFRSMYPSSPQIWKAKSLGGLAGSGSKGKGLDASCLGQREAAWIHSGRS